MRRTKAQRKKHAADERARYRVLKNGLIRAIASTNGMGTPTCSMPSTKPGLLCGDLGPLEIDHKHFSKFKQRSWNSVQRLERFAIEFVKWLGGDDRCELRIAYRKCNAKHQPKRG